MCFFWFSIELRNGARFFRVRLPGLFSLLLAWQAAAGNFYSGTSPANVPWPGGIVPYQFTNTLSAAQTNTYLAGLREWELAANVKFVPRTNQARWILFTYNTNWIDNVSSTTNPQVVTVSSLSRAQVGHEMGHSFGFTHENIRPDAANFISVLTNNISGESSNIVFFTIDPTSVTNGNYDYESVMHLGWNFESTNIATPTQQPRPPNFPRYQYRMGNLCLSPGDRAALAYLYGPPAVPLTNVVTTTADVGPGSLRAAIYYATDHAATTVKFNIPNGDPGYSNGVFNIHLTGHLPPLVANGTVIDGSTQPGFASKPLIVVDGSQIILETFTSNSGLLIYSASNQVKNISFSGFNWNGLTLEFADATNNTIAGCWLGLGVNGSTSASNAYQGILFSLGASHNTIGGTNALARNVISGNGQYGLWMSDTNTTGNVILGNFIGTDASGSNAVPNPLGGISIFNNGTGHVIGGTNTGAGNVISGNGGAGIWLAGTNVSNVTVRGNFIGLNAAGTAGVTNLSDGIYLLNGASGNLIGGTSTNARNVISGNKQYGILIADSGTSGNSVLGNFIGTDFTGTNAVGNGSIGIGITTNAGANMIGGAAAGAGNLLSGNTNYGIALIGVSSNFVQGNFIGTELTGRKALINGLQTNGIGLWGGAANNQIGGTGGAGNIISGNKQYGIYISDFGTSNNVVQGNFIGTDVAGTNAIGNTGFGIGIWSGASGNLVGGTSAGAGNLISGNPGFSYGIAIGGANSNLVEGNFIGTDLSGTNALANGFADIGIYSGSTGNVIGGTGAGAGNTIAFAAEAGVVLYEADTTNNSIRGNSIFSNGYLGINFGNLGVIANDTGDADTGPNNYQNFPVITNAFGYAASTIVQGKFNSATNRSFFVDVYRNLAEDISGYGQGQFYLGSVSVTTDGSGNANFAYTNSGGNYSGQYISTTATDTSGNTSEFSADVLASNAPAPSAQFAAPFVWSTNGFVFTLNFATNFSYHVQATTNLANPLAWVSLTNFTASNISLTFTDRTATSFRMRFYRVVSP